MLWDTHMHTAFSTDSETSPESMINWDLAESALPTIWIMIIQKNIRRMNRNLS